MSEPAYHEAREAGTAEHIERSQESWKAVVDTVGPYVFGAGGVGAAAKVIKDIAVAKINANAQVEVARIENGYPQLGGTHRADE